MERKSTVDNRVTARTASERQSVSRRILLTVMPVLLLAIGSLILVKLLNTGVLPGADQDATSSDAQGMVPASELTGTKGPHPGWQPPPMPQPAPFANVNIDPVIAAELADQWGVEVQGMRLTSAGYMLDFRFRVLDADKALPLFDHRIKPHIVAERSNIKLPVPMAAKVGAFRPTNRGKNIKADKTYYMIFGNPDRHVKAGETVTVAIGDFKVEHLMVN